MCFDYLFLYHTIWYSNGLSSSLNSIASTNVNFLCSTWIKFENILCSVTVEPFRISDVSHSRVVCPLWLKWEDEKEKGCVNAIGHKPTPSLLCRDKWECKHHLSVSWPFPSLLMWISSLNLSLSKETSALWAHCLLVSSYLAAGGCCCYGFVRDPWVTR